MLFEKQVEQIFRKTLYTRNDNKGRVFYFSAADFPGLQTHPYTFHANAGHELRGCFYHYADPIPGRLLVFDHGLGNGHRPYMREVERLAKAGFLVFTYDHTGCMESGGENTNGFAQSLNDLDACIKALKAEPQLAGRRISVMGHSWGGFSTMNIAALHPEITHVVSMAGFVSVERIVNQTFSGILMGYREGIMALERRANPDYVDFDAAESLKKTKAKVLLVYSDDDSMISREQHYDVLKRELEGRENIQLLLVEGRDHNPAYTTEAVRYKNAFFKELQQLKKKKPSRKAAMKFMAGFDWWRMTEQDEEVWKVILNTLEA